MIHFSSRSPGRSPLPSMRSMICNSPGPKTPAGKELSGSYTNIEHNLLSLSSKSMRNKCWRKRWRARFKTWFFGFNCTTRQVYEEGAKAVALLVVGGINFHFPITFSAASVFAYGQTSSGKTYTMTGITQYIMADIFEYIQKHKEREFLLKFFAMEIYNKSVRDLLSLDTTPLRLLDDP